MRFLAIVIIALSCVGVAGAQESPYETVAKWNCSAPCTITYSIDDSYPARSAALVREVYRDISIAPEIEFVETKGGPKVKWETCESTRTGLCGFWARFTFVKGNRDFATIKGVEVVIDTTTWNELVDLKSYICHEALHTVGFAHAPRYFPSCFNGTSPTYQPGQEDYELITMMYG